MGGGPQVTAEEIRAKWSTPSWDSGLDDQTVHYSILDVLVEIAAQIAELNAKQADGPKGG
jgi:hypothetical protein